MTEKNVKNAEATANNAVKTYYIFDLVAFYAGKNPISEMQTDAATVAEMIDYYDGELEAYATMGEAHEAHRWYQRNR